LCCVYYTGESSFEVQTKRDSSDHAKHTDDDEHSTVYNEGKQDGNAVLPSGGHNEKKMYQCYVCYKAFTHSGYLKYHIRIHTGEKPYNCSLCNKRFARTTQLKAHKCRVQSSATSVMQQNDNITLECGTGDCSAEDKEEKLSLDDVCCVWYFV